MRNWTRFITVIEIPDGNSTKLELSEVSGDYFVYRGGVFYYFQQKNTQVWFIIDPYTGIAYHWDPNPINLMLRLFFFLDNQTTKHVEQYHGKVMELKKAGIKLPVNKVQCIKWRKK